MTPYQLNLQQLQRFWRVAKPYWISSEWGAIVLLLLLLLLSFIGAGLLVLVSIFLGEVTSALAEQDRDRFTQSLVVFIGAIILGVPLLSLKTYIQAKLSLHWRRWLTDRFLSHYFAEDRFYAISIHAAIDNPDQRIAEDIRTFTQQSLFFIVILFDAIIQLIAFTGVLWSISKPLMIFLIVYAIVGTFATTILFGRVLVGINAEQLKREADFRFGLVRVRENAEAIACYQGQLPESQQVWQQFLSAYRNFNHLVRWQLGLNLFQNSYQYVTFLLPALILAPRIIAGELEVGAEAQAGTAFRVILLALALVVKQFEQLTTFIASVDRLDALATFSTPVSANAPQIEVIEAEHLSLRHLTLYTPNYQILLIRDLSLTLSPDQALLITGANGVGKSSLLRAIAGLWKAGSGQITRPQQNILFLPQRPYLCLGSLREQLIYPHGDLEIQDEQLLQILARVNLPDLAERFDGLTTIIDWTQVLSIGEQQRLAFARLLLTQPKYAMLDEATSGLDLDNEKHLYQQLQASSIAYISVAHRSSLLPYHHLVLKLTASQSWYLEDT